MLQPTKSDILVELIRLREHTQGNADEFRKSFSNPLRSTESRVYLNKIIVRYEHTVACINAVLNMVQWKPIDEIEKEGWGDNEDQGPTVILGHFGKSGILLWAADGCWDGKANTWECSFEFIVQFPPNYFIYITLSL